jgi:hypothetical protein
VQSVVAGTNVTVDSTDPANPIVNATGGGGSSTFDGLIDVDVYAAVDGDVPIYDQATGTWVAGPQTGGGGGSELFVYKAADTTRASTTTLADDPDLAVTLEANSVYEFEALLFYESPSACAIKWSPNFTGTTTFIKWLTEQGHNNTTAFGSMHTVYYQGVYDVEPGATPPGWTAGYGSFVGYGRVRGLISVGASGGTFAMQWAQQNSSATAATLYKGSFMRVKKVA